MLDFPGGGSLLGKDWTNTLERLCSIVSDKTARGAMLHLEGHRPMYGTSLPFDCLLAVQHHSRDFVWGKGMHQVLGFEVGCDISTSIQLGDLANAQIVQAPEESLQTYAHLCQHKAA